jgi:hypothetical protein
MREKQMTYEQWTAQEQMTQREQDPKYKGKDSCKILDDM